MDELMIILVVLQALLLAGGYIALARQIESERRKVELLGGLAFVIPFFAFAVLIIDRGVTGEEFVWFFEFYVYSVLANALTSAVIKGVEMALIGGER